MYLVQKKYYSKRAEKTFETMSEELTVEGNICEVINLQNAYMNKKRSN